MNETQRPSTLITWCGRIAIISLVVLPLSVAGVKFGLLHFSAGLLLFALSCLAALVALLVLAIVSFLPRFATERARALRLSLLCVPPVLLLGALLGSSGDYPAIHDITTDPADPPLFQRGITERGSDSNTLDIKPEVIALQREHYADLSTVSSPLPPAEAFARAASIAESLSWEVYNADPANGLIEAAYTSFWFGFVDDIAIRIRAADTGSEVDLRSISRVGQGDLGANAKRIRAFTERFER